MGDSSTISYSTEKLGVNPEPSLDEALEQVVLALESDAPLDRERLLSQFPQWTHDINQFIDNWLLWNIARRLWWKGQRLNSTFHPSI